MVLSGEWMLVMQPRMEERVQAVHVSCLPNSRMAFLLLSPPSRGAVLVADPRTAACSHRALKAKVELWGGCGPEGPKVGTAVMLGWWRSVPANRGTELRQRPRATAAPR